MATRGSFEIKGLDAYLEDLVNAGIDVDQVVADVLTEAAPIAESTLNENLERVAETWTGGTAATIATSAVQHDGNYHYIELSVGGAGTTGEGARALEYGNTRQSAKPFLRPAFAKLRHNKLKAMMKEIMQKFGLPT